MERGLRCAKLLPFLFSSLSPPGLLAFELRLGRRPCSITPVRGPAAQE